MVGIVGFLISLLNTKIRVESSRILAFFLYSLLVFFISFKRKDLDFLRLYFPNYYIVIILENIFISLPLLIILVYYNLWLYIGIYLVLLVFSSIFRVEINKRTVNSIIQQKIPDYNFEWKAGFRKNLFVLVFLWFTGLLASFFMATIPVVVFFLGIIILNFYEKTETLEMLFAQELNSKQFLRNKILCHLKDFSILISPLIIVFIIFHFQYYYIALVEFFAFLILIIYSILLKYTFYKPDEKSGAMQTFMSFGIISLFIPFLLPVTLILAVVFAYKSHNNLKYYLDDFNK